METVISKMWWFQFIFVLASCVIPATLACNGYELKVNAIKNCGSANVIQLKDMKAALDKDCNIVLNGCAVITKTVKQAKAHYKLSKPPMPPLEGDVDLCELLEDNSIAEMAELLSLFGVTGKCPVSAKNACVKGKKISISKYKNQLGIAVGTIDVMLNLDHGGGGKSCANINMNIKRK